MKKLANGERYLCKQGWGHGHANLYAGYPCDRFKFETWDKNHVGYLMSIYGGFAPHMWAELANGFTSKKTLTAFCQENGFAIYWLLPSSSK